MQTEQTKIITHSITRYLSRREHSYHEILQKLELKSLDRGLCEQQLDKFVENGIQSNERFAHSVVRSAYNKGKGPAYVSQKCKQHHVDSHLYTDYMRTEEFDWFTLANQVRSKRFGSASNLSFDDKQKQKRFLLGRGFELEQIEAAFE